MEREEAAWQERLAREKAQKAQSEQALLAAFNEGRIIREAERNGNFDKNPSANMRYESAADQLRADVAARLVKSTNPPQKPNTQTADFVPQSQLLREAAAARQANLQAAKQSSALAQQNQFHNKETRQEPQMNTLPKLANGTPPKGKPLLPDIEALFNDTYKMELQSGQTPEKAKEIAAHNTYIESGRSVASEFLRRVFEKNAEAKIDFEAAIPICAEQLQKLFSNCYDLVYKGLGEYGRSTCRSRAEDNRGKHSHRPAFGQGGSKSR